MYYSHNKNKKGKEVIIMLKPNEINNILENYLSPEVAKAAYEKIELNNRMEDVKRHAKKRGLILNDEQAYELAKIFIDNYDCNITENDQFETIIDGFIKKRNELLGKKEVVNKEERERYPSPFLSHILDILFDGDNDEEDEDTDENNTKEFRVDTNETKEKLCNIKFEKLFSDLVNDLYEQLYPFLNKEKSDLLLAYINEIKCRYNNLDNKCKNYERQLNDATKKLDNIRNLLK